MVLQHVIRPAFPGAGLGSNPRSENAEQLLAGRDQRNREALRHGASNGCTSQLLPEAEEQIGKPFQKQGPLNPGQASH